jgi:hypothetical protein
MLPRAELRAFVSFNDSLDRGFASQNVDHGAVAEP